SSLSDANTIDAAVGESTDILIGEAHDGYRILVDADAGFCEEILRTLKRLEQIRTDPLELEVRRVPEARDVRSADNVAEAEAKSLEEQIAHYYGLGHFRGIEEEQHRGSSEELTPHSGLPAYRVERLAYR